MQAVILAAGKGTRMRSKHPKVLQQVFGKPLLAYVLETLKTLGVKKPIVVIGNGAKEVRSFLNQTKALGISPKVVLQKQQKGTGHAVSMAKSLLKGNNEDVLIWPGDMPLLRVETIREFLKAHRDSKADASVLSSIHRDPTGYGRILRDGGWFYAIREELDATEWERQVQEVNSGVYLFKNKTLKNALKELKPTNKKKEFYLTDTIEILASDKKSIEAFSLAEEEEAIGVNSRADLADVGREVCMREIALHQSRGVTILAPEQTYIEPGAKIGSDTIIYPWSYIETDVTIGEGCHIGPFAKVRSKTKVGNDSVVGSFVEVCRAKIGNKVLAKHLSYLGDATIGDGTNIGAGVVTANFDGKNKNQTSIGKKVLVGSNTVFVAPVSVGEGARTGAGSVLTSKTRVQKKDIVVGVPAKSIRKNKRK